MRHPASDRRLRRPLTQRSQDGTLISEMWLKKVEGLSEPTDIMSAGELHRDIGPALRRHCADGTVQEIWYHDGVQYQPNAPDRLAWDSRGAALVAILVAWRLALGRPGH